MFKFLKEKLKNAVEIFSKKAEEGAKEEIKEEIREEIKEEKPKKEVKEKKQEKIEKKEEIVIEEKAEEKPEIKEDKKGFFEKIKDKFKKKEEIKEEKAEEKPEIKEEAGEKKGFFEKIKEKITTVKISGDKFDELFSELEIVLLENNVAVEVIDKIKEDLNKSLVERQIKRGEVEKEIKESLKESISKILTVPRLDLLKLVKDIRKENRPAVFIILGYNGTGKSLSAARLANYLKNKGLKPLLAAGDTFRAAGVAQTEEYAKKIEVPVIKHQMGSDSCAVIFDAISSAKAKNYDIVIADTAGRIHSNADLMDELKKIVRVNKPDLKILVLDALTGTDIVEQARKFDEAVGVDALIITKVDAYEKGGGILSGTYILKKPVLFFGVGQGMSDFKEYNPEEVLQNLGLGEEKH